MICNFSRRSGIDALAGKIRNGVKIELDDIRVISPGIIPKSNNLAPPLVEKKTLKQSIFKIIKFPWKVRNSIEKIAGVSAYAAIAGVCILKGLSIDD